MPKERQGEEEKRQKSLRSSRWKGWVEERDSWKVGEVSKEK